MNRRILGAAALATVLATSVMAAPSPVAADTAPGGAKMPTALHSFVVAAHTDFLGRHPSAQELRYLHQIAKSRGKAAVLRSMASSDAWVSALVTRFYFDTFGRVPDPAGLAHWRTQIVQRRMSVAGVAARFYASEEYFDGIGGGTVSSWVTDLYQKLLGRSPDAEGLAWWVERTPTEGRIQVAAEMYQSMESRRQRVGVLYDVAPRPHPRRRRPATTGPPGSSAKATSPSRSASRPAASTPLGPSPGSPRSSTGRCPAPLGTPRAGSP